MTSQDASPETTPRVVFAESAEELLSTVAPEAIWADDERVATALTWVSEPEVAERTTEAKFDAEPVAETRASALAGAKLRRAGARAAIAPLCVVLILGGGYAATTLLWPLHEIKPVAQGVGFTPASAPAVIPTWPALGSAAIGISGMNTVASSTDASPMASITKVVTSLMVLDRMPLALGEQGPEFRFNGYDNLDYWSYRRTNQSALDVPIGGVLTEYQMLQGTLIGSANNYIDRLAKEIWGPRSEFVAAAETWLAARGLSDITVVSPSGFDGGNTATPESLVRLAEYAMQNPVIAEIVSTVSVELPGAGLVTNTNGMLADAGVVGVKTGTYDGWHLLTAKDLTIGDTDVHLYAAVLGQDNDEERLAATRVLFAEAEAALIAQEPTVPAGTVVGSVSSIWGATADIVTRDDTKVVLWDGATATSFPQFTLGEKRASGAEVGALMTRGPIDSVETPLVLATEIEEPSAWWRLTHPMEILGLSAR